MFYFSQQVKVILSVECLFLDYSTLLLGGRDLVKQEEIGSEWSDMFLISSPRNTKLLFNGRELLQSFTSKTGFLY